MEMDTSSGNSDATSSNGGPFVDMSDSDKRMWLLKFPAPLSRPLHVGGDGVGPSTRPVAKLVHAFDPLLPKEHFSHHQVTMELIGNEPGNAPQRYSMDKVRDFDPVAVFSESSQGNIAVEGKLLKIFDMDVHKDRTEQNTQQELVVAGENCQKFQGALLEANEAFASLMQENERMEKSIKELNMQNVLLREQLQECRIHKDRLESLCRALQAERKKGNTSL